MLTAFPHRKMSFSVGNLHFTWSTCFFCSLNEIPEKNIYFAFIYPVKFLVKHHYKTHKNLGQINFHSITVTGQRSLHVQLWVSICLNKCFCSYRLWDIREVYRRQMLKCWVQSWPQQTFSLLPCEAQFDMEKAQSTQNNRWLVHISQGIRFRQTCHFWWPELFVPGEISSMKWTLLDQAQFIAWMQLKTSDSKF